MVASEFLDYLTKFQVATYIGVEDFTDKLNFLITVIFLLLCTTVVTVKQYMMKAISCYLSTDIGGKNILDYVENYCWVEGTVGLPSNQKVPENAAEWAKLNEHKITYYQWVPFVLGLQGIMFYLPRIIWQIVCYSRLGTDIQHLVVSANRAAHASASEREKLVQQVSRSLEQLLYHRQIMYTNSRNRYIESQAAVTGQSAAVTPRHYLSMEIQSVAELERLSTSKSLLSEAASTTDYRKWSRGKTHQLASLTEPSSLVVRLCRSFCCLVCDRHRGAFLCSAYLFIKLLYLANAIGQLFLMEYFLGFANSKYRFFGYAMLLNMLTGRHWESTQVFPRVVLCSAETHILGSNISVTAQCLLPVNMLNEKIYIFLWWWVLLVTTVTAFSLLRWCFRMISRNNAMDFVVKYLKLANGYAMVVEGKGRLSDQESTDDDDAVSVEPLMHDFVNSFLRKDGVFLLRMLALNAGEIVTFEVITAIWTVYQGRMMKIERARKKRKGYVTKASAKHPTAPAPAQSYNEKMCVGHRAGDTGFIVPFLQNQLQKNDARSIIKRSEGREIQPELYDAKESHSLV